MPSHMIRLREASEIMGYTPKGLLGRLRRGDGPRLIVVGPKKSGLDRAEFLAWVAELGIKVPQAA